MEMRGDISGGAVETVLTRLLESVYDDGVDEILEVSPTSGGGFAGKFLSGEQVFDFEYRGGAISIVESRRDSIDAYWLDCLQQARMDGDAYLAAYYETRMDAPKRPGKRNCKKGKSCGGACIAAGKVCRKKLSAEENEAAKAAAAFLLNQIRKKGGNFGDLRSQTIRPFQTTRDIRTNPRVQGAQRSRQETRALDRIADKNRRASSTAFNASISARKPGSLAEGLRRAREKQARFQQEIAAGRITRPSSSRRTAGGRKGRSRTGVRTR